MEDKQEFKIVSKATNELELTRVQELQVEERSMAQALATHYVEGVGTGAGLATAALAKETIAAGVEKVKDALKPTESPIELPPGVDRPD
jgi:hypothetical protein